MGRHPPSSRHRQAGLTLVELLAAMGIFLGLAAMVMQVLGGGLDLWRGGERSRQSRDQGSVLLDRLEQELRELVIPAPGSSGEPRAKFVCDFISQDPDGDGIFDYRSQRLVFVRNVIEQRTHPHLRDAGYEAGDGLFYEGQGAYWTPQELADVQGQDPDQDPDQDPGAQLVPFFLATEGSCEIYLCTYPDNREEYQGRLVLWRALRSPIGGGGSLFNGLVERTGILDEAVPMEAMAENLLHLGFEFFDGETLDLSADAGQGGASRTWDSTRGILEPGEGPQAFRYAVGPSSLSNPEDDVFPRAIRITIIVELPPEQSFEARLLEPLGADDRVSTLRVANGGFLRDLDQTPLYARIGHEWVQLGSTGGGTVAVRRRGVFGTVVSPHPEGSLLMVGRRYSRIVRIPVWRDPAPRTRTQR